MMDKNDNMTKAGSYEAYAPVKVTLASATHDVVLFFRASWCPTCRAVDADIKANLSKIPSSLAILDVNYDDSTALKQRYGVTYQHTFVQVDKDGNLIKKWSGSPTLSALVAEVK
jgi:thiol-disulfide isomerase/thioredoxin